MSYTTNYTDEYGHKATTKLKYRQSAENPGIKFGE